MCQTLCPLSPSWVPKAAPISPSTLKTSWIKWINHLNRPCTVSYSSPLLPKMSQMTSFPSKLPSSTRILCASSNHLNKPILKIPSQPTWRPVNPPIRPIVQQVISFRVAKAANPKYRSKKRKVKTLTANRRLTFRALTRIRVFLLRSLSLRTLPQTSFRWYDRLNR